MAGCSPDMGHFLFVETKGRQNQKADNAIVKAYLFPSSLYFQESCFKTSGVLSSMAKPSILEVPRSLTIISFIHPDSIIRD